MPNFGMESAPDLSQKKDKVTTVSEDNFEADVNKTFGDESIDVEIDASLESKGVVAVAGEALRADELIQKYIASGHGKIVDDVIKEMTTDPKLIKKFYGKLADAPDKAAHIEAATKRLTDTMKEVVITEVLLKDSLIGNA